MYDIKKILSIAKSLSPESVQITNLDNGIREFYSLVYGIQWYECGGCEPTVTYKEMLSNMREQKINEILK